MTFRLTPLLSIQRDLTDVLRLIKINKKIFTLASIPPSPSSFFPPPPPSLSLVITNLFPIHLQSLQSKNQTNPKKRLNHKLGRPKDHDQMRRRTRSMSPQRNLPFDWNNEDDEGRPGKAKFGGEKEEGNVESTEKKEETLSSEATLSMSTSSSRSSSAGRSFKRWALLKNFLGARAKGRAQQVLGDHFLLPAKEKRPSPNNVGPKEKNSDPAEGIGGARQRKEEGWFRRVAVGGAEELADVPGVSRRVVWVVELAGRGGWNGGRGRQRKAMGWRKRKLTLNFFIFFSVPRRTSVKPHWIGGNGVGRRATVDKAS